MRSPKLRVGRLDRDVVKRRGAAARVIDDFAEGRLDVLVGTSLVTKGLDVPEVTLVGVVSADVALNLPDERAAERTYQLLTQAVGRAGRGERPGRALIQTYQPDHPAIRAVADGDAQDILRIVVLALAVIVLILLVIIPVLRWRTTHYVITTHRVMVRTGILSRHGKDIGLTRITDVSYTQSLWDRIIGAGTLTIESAGEGPPQVFRNIPNSDDTQQLINHLVEEDEQSRARDSAQYLGEAYRDLDDEPGQK